MWRLRRYERISVENRRFRSNGGQMTKIIGRRGYPTKHSSFQKTRLNDVSCGTKIWTDRSSVLSQCMRLTDRQTDGQTDERTAFSLLYRVCIPCSAVKTLTSLTIWFRVKKNKKLIRRWDSERELSLRRHRTRSTKYNRLVHKFRHRSTRLCVGSHVYQIQWNNAI